MGLSIQIVPRLGEAPAWYGQLLASITRILLLGVRGSSPFTDKSRRSWVLNRRTRHSKKPFVFRELIEQVSPGPYLELFGREEQPRTEWTVYGKGTGKKQATAARNAIDDLIDSVEAKVDPSANTKYWLEEVANEAVCKSLVGFNIISEMPLRFQVSERFTTISMLADEYIRTRCAGLDDETVVIYKKGRKNLLKCFGDVDITKLTKRDGREFWRWLLKEEDYAENTAKHRLRLARAIFELAIEDELISMNPFKARGLSVSQTAAEKEYVERETIATVVASCPSLEWKLLFTLCRKVPIRMPSEIREFTWDDVDWDNNQMLIHSPKTRRIGKSARLIPIFPEVKDCLKELLNSDEAASDYVFSKLRHDTNPGTMAKKIVKRANIKPWKNFFNSLRATAETDLMDEYGLRRACQWAGNSAGTAMKNYALVKKTDFTDSGTQSDPEKEVSKRARMRSRIWTKKALPKAPL